MSKLPSILRKRLEVAVVQKLIPIFKEMGEKKNVGCSLLEHLLQEQDLNLL